MIVKPLKSNIQLSIAILLLFSIVLCVGVFSFVSTDASNFDYKEHVLFSYFSPTNSSLIFNQIIAMVVILIGGFLLNFLAIQQEIISRTNYLPTFFYILFSYSSASKGVVEPLLVANIFVLLALYFLINSYRIDYAFGECYKAGFFMGIASFFCIQYIIVFPLCFIALVILRSFNWREWIILFFGLITPLYVYVFLCYLTTNDAFAVFGMMNKSLLTVQKPVVSEYYISFILITIIAFIGAFVKYLKIGFGGKVKTQKTKYILLWMLLFCLIIVFFKQKSDMFLLPCIIPLSIILGDYLEEIKKMKIANTWLMLFIMGFSIIYFHAMGII